MLKDLTVTIDGKSCTNLVGTLANFTCDLPKNTDNTPILSAGSHYPVVTIKGMGTADRDALVAAIIVNFDLTSSNPSTGGNNGGYSIVIAGVGFP